MMLSKAIVSPPFSLFYHNTKFLVLSDSSQGLPLPDRYEWEQHLLIEHFRASVFFLKLLYENSLLNIFFSCLNVMIKTMENCMASQ